MTTSTHFRTLFAALFLSGLLSGLLATAARSETLKVQSTNPFTFVGVLSDTPSDPVELAVDLAYPGDPRPANGHPAILFVHGAGGPQAHHAAWLSLFRELGIATAYADHFKPRGKDSAVGSHIQLTGAAMTADAFAILNVLAEHPDIDPDRIAIMGSSKGGGVALYSTWKLLQEKLSPGRRFAAHIPLYPTCVSWDEPAPTRSPVLVLLGAGDDWTGVDDCKRSIESFQQAGHDQYSYKVYPEARHGFDSNAPERKIESAFNVTGCAFTIGPDGKDYADGIFMDTPENKRKALSGCIRRGVTYGGNPKALEAARRDVGAFLQGVLSD